MKIHPLLSIGLDVLRFAMALLVLLGHWADAFGWPVPDAIALAGVAVGVFFVVSGFTIQTLWHGDPAPSASRFLIDRMTRLWSVVLPALALTVLLDVATVLLARDYYAACCGSAISHAGARLAINGLFLSELWGLGISPLSNSPFWSLAYEAMFYSAFWLWHARPATRPWSVLLILLVAGPAFPLFLSLWLLGVLVSWLLFTQRRGAVVLAFVAALALPALLIGVSGPAEAPRAAIDAVRGWVIWIDLHYPFLGAGHKYFNAPLVFGALSVTWLACLLLPLLRWLEHEGTHRQWARALVKPARRLGDATFPLYLVHYPALVLLAGLTLAVQREVPGALAQAAMIGAIVAAAFVMAPRCDHLKRRMRDALQRLVDRTAA